MTLFAATRLVDFAVDFDRQAAIAQGTRHKARQGKTRHSARDKCADAINRVLASPA